MTKHQDENPIIGKAESPQAISENFELLRQVEIPKNVSLQEYLEIMELELCDEDGKKTARAITNHPPVTIAEQEKLIAATIMAMRRERKLTRAQMGGFFNSIDQTYGRYERAEHSLTIGMFINLCEIFDCMPFEIIGESTPQIWSRDEETSALMLKLMRLLAQMPKEKLELIFKLITPLASASTDS